MSAVFLRSAKDKKDYPPGGYAEIGFAGRSNVGKSSALNTLLNRHTLVKTSKTPGHTRSLNFFFINNKFVFVDFPGYGFARVPLEVKREWGVMMETYLTSRPQLAGVVSLVDARHDPFDSDKELINYLKMKNVPIIIAATKADKLPRSQQAQLTPNYRAEFGEHVPVVAFSATTGLGKHELWKQIGILLAERSAAARP